MTRLSIGRHAGAVLAALGLLGTAAASAQTPALQDITIALPALSLSFTMDYLAQDLGLFAKHGLRVKMIELPGVGAINALISGSADVAQPSASTLTRAAARGQRLLAIVETVDRPVVQIVLRNEVAKAAHFDAAAPLAQRATSMRGRTIAVDAVNSLIHAYVRLVARRAGYDPEAINIAVMAPPNMIAAFAAGQIDGFAMSPPWPLKPVLEGKAVVLASGPDGDPPDLVPFGNNVVAVRPDTCTRRKPVCEGVGHALAEAALIMRDHPEVVLPVLKKRFPTLDDALLAASFEMVRKITPVPPVVSKESIENTEIFNIDAGLLKPEEKLKSYDGLYTDEYVR